MKHIILKVLKAYVFRKTSLIPTLSILIFLFIKEINAILKLCDFKDFLYKMIDDYQLPAYVVTISKALVDFLFTGNLIVACIEGLLMVLVGFLIFYLHRKSLDTGLDSELIEETHEMVGGIERGVEIINERLEYLLSQKKTSNETLKVFEEVIKESENLYRNGKPNQALKILSQLDKLSHLVEDHPDLKSDLQIAQAKALEESEKFDEAIQKCQQITSDYPERISPYLILAEIYSGINNEEESQENLNRASEIDEDHPVLKTIKWLRMINKQADIVISDDEKWGDEGSRERALCYYVHAIIADKKSDSIKRDNYIDLAVKMQPDMLLLKLAEIHFRITDINRKIKSQETLPGLEEILKNILREIEELENLCELDDCPGRKLRVYMCKLLALVSSPSLINQQLIKSTFQNISGLIEECYFNNRTDQAISILLDAATPLISKKFIDKIINYIRRSKKSPSDNLMFLIIVNSISIFETYDTLKDLCEYYEKPILIKLLEAVENADVTRTTRVLVEYFDDDRIIQFLRCLREDYIDFKLEIIDQMPEKFKGKYETLKLAALTFEKEDFDSALKIIKGIDINNASFMECIIAATVAENFGFLETEKIALKRILSFGILSKYEEAAKATRLVIVAYLLDEFRDALQKGYKALENWRLISKENAQKLLYICLDVLRKEGKSSEAIALLEKHDELEMNYPLCLVLAEIYIDLRRYDESLKSIIEGLRKIEILNDDLFLEVHIPVLRALKFKKDGFQEKYSVSTNSYIHVDNVDRWFYIGEGKPLDAEYLAERDPRYSVLVNKKLVDEIEWPADEYMKSKGKRKIDFIADEELYICKRGADAMIKLSNVGSPYAKAIEIGSDSETVKSTLLKVFSREKENFRLYEQRKIPLSCLITLNGSVGMTFSRIRTEEKSFIYINNGDVADLETQKSSAELALGGNPVYIDGTSLFVLIESGALEIVLSELSNYSVPARVLDEYRDLIDRFDVDAENGTMHLGYKHDEIVLSKVSKEEAEQIRNKIIKDYKFIQNNASEIYGIPNAEKFDDFIEQNVSPIVSDACIKAQRDSDSIVLTEDPSYIYLNSERTNKRNPAHFSVWALVRRLLELKKIDWEFYVNIFYVLSIYREHFLQITVDDLEHCLYEKSGHIITINPNNLDKLNLSLVWSVDYGVDTGSLLRVASDFLAKIILDRSIKKELLVEIFLKIISPVLDGRNKSVIGDVLLTLVKQKALSGVFIMRDIDERINLLNFYLTNPGLN